MELLQLKYFCESAKNESFAKVAKKYMVPLTSVSIAIKHLEEELGVKLFDRASNRVFLNNKGRQFYYSVQSMFNELDNGITGLKLHTGDKRQIRILAKTTREDIIHHAIAFNKFYPDARFSVDIHQVISDEDIDNYDIIVDEKTDRYIDFDSFDLASYKIYIECLSSNPLCQRDSITLKHLKNQPFVTTNMESESFALLTKACKKAGFLPNIVLECNDYTCRNHCVLSGMGLGVTLGISTNSSLPNVQFLNVTDFNERFTSRIYYKSSAYFGNVKAFIDLVKTRLM